MLKKLLLLSAIMLSAFVAGRFFYDSNYTEPPIENLYGIGTTENEDAYSEYQFKRLRNPAAGEIPKDIRKKELAFAATLPKDNSRSETWQARGPFNLGGRTRALALDATDENVILAGQVSGGMWRSTDGGAHFIKTTTPEQIHSATCIAQDTRTGKTNVWYYGTGETYGIVNAAGFSSQFSGDGIFKSTDGGATWNQLPSTVSNSPATLYQKRDFDFVWEMVTDATNLTEDEVYAAVVNGIWRSVDGGNSWNAVLGLDTTVNAVSEFTDIAITSAGVLYATISSETPSKGIWRSADGIAWTRITPAGFPASYRRIEIGIAPSDETQVFFIAETQGSGATGHNLWKYKYWSGDGSGAGGQWKNKTANLPNDHCTGFYTFDFAKFSSQNSYDLYVAVSPDDTNAVYLGGTNIFRSVDGFSSTTYDWIGGYQCDTAKLSNYVYPNHHPDQHKLLFLPSNHNIAISASDGGIMKTQNILASTVTWENLNNGYNTGQFYTCAIEPGNTTNEIMIGGLQDNGTFFTNTLDYNQDWQHSFYGDGGYCAITRNRTNYYLSWQTGKVFKFDIADDGTVDNLTRIDPASAGNSYLFIAPFILDPTSDSIMYLSAGRTLWRNDDLASIPMTGNEYNTITTNWNKLNGTTTGILFNSPAISTLDISEANPNILFFGTDNGKLYKLDSCRLNTTQKQDISGVNFPAGAYVSCVEPDRLNPAHILVTFSNYGIPSIFYTNDGGANWTAVSGNLEENPDGSGNGPSVAWGHIYNDGTSVKYFAGTSIGLFSAMQLDGANTVWTQEGATAIGNVVINMIASRVHDGNIVVATHGNGMYSNKIYQPAAAVESNIRQPECAVFPNPFSDFAFIKIQTEELLPLSVQVFDISGKLISKIAAVKPVNGKIIFQWNGKDIRGNNCAPGLYPCVVHIGKNRVLLRLYKV